MLKRINYRGFLNYFEARKWADKQRGYRKQVNIRRLKDVINGKSGYGVYVYERKR